MVLKNYYVALGKLILNKAHNAGISYTGESVTPANTNAVSIHSIITSPKSDYLGSDGVKFGTGTTPVTFEDYCLSGDMINNLAFSTVTQHASDNNGVHITAVYTITNNNPTDVTIGEVGMMYRHVTSQTGIVGNYMLIERTVLDTPVTIPAGGIGQVVYTITFNYPTST